MSDPADGPDPMLPAPTLPPAQPAPRDSPTPPTSDAPTPPILPTPPSSDAPYLPSAVLPTPTRNEAPAAEPEFDAKAMVEAQKRFDTNPAYGALPAASPESRAAAQALRDKARKKRRRNKVLGWGVVVILLAGIAAAGYFGYTAYQKDQDKQAAEREAAATDGEQTDGGFAGPLGEQGEIIETIDELSGGATASAGGLLDAVDNAREVMGQTQPDPLATVPPDQQAPLPGIVPEVAWEETGLHGFTYRRYDGAAIDSSNTSYQFTYDPTTDHYSFISVLTSDEADGRLFGTASDDWISGATVDGELVRFRRSAQSADPGPDLPQAQLMNEESPLPGGARAYATPFDVGSILVGGSSDGDTYDVQGYLVNVAAYRAGAPESYSSWVDTWTAAGPNDPSFVEPDTAQTSDVHLTGLGLDEYEPFRAYFANGEPDLTDQALVAFSLTPEGFVNLAVIVDPVSDFRAEYLLHDIEPAAADLLTLLDDRQWIEP